MIPQKKDGRFARIELAGHVDFQMVPLGEGRKYVPVVLLRSALQRIQSVVHGYAETTLHYSSHQYLITNFGNVFPTLDQAGKTSY